MPKITRIEFQQKNKERVSIYLDEEYAFGIDAELVYKFNLERGMELTQEYIDEVLRQEERKKAKNYAVYLISNKLRTESEIRKKMKEKGYVEEDINESIELLYKYGYINDNQYADLFTKEKVRVKKWGPNRIKQELYRKGVDKETIQQALEENSDEQREYDLAYSLAERKLVSLSKEEDKRKVYQKLTQFLQRRGYSFDTIRKVLNELL